jgi:replicative DNA helicase
MIEDNNILRAFPHAHGPEKGTLSVLWNHPQKFDDAPDLTADHYYLQGHRTIYLLMRELWTAGKEIESISFVQYLIDRGELEKIGGPAAISEIMCYAPSASNFDEHLKILTDQLARRMTIAAAHEMERVAYDGDPVEILESTSAPISAIHDILTGTGPSRSTKAVLTSCMDRFQQLCIGKVDPMGIETSLFEINHRFRGLHGKQTIVISGYPGAGKTTLAAQLAMDAALAGHNTLICSLEMPEQTMMDRLLAYVAGIHGDAITDPLRYSKEILRADRPTMAFLNSIKSAAQKINASPLAIEDLIGANVYQIAARIRRAHRKQPVVVAVVDFVQRIRPVPDMRRESREQQLAHASNHLCDLSKELGFCLLLPSQLNKEGAAKHAEAINEDADLHLQIVQDRSGPSPTYAHQGIAVVKDRHAGHDGTLLQIVLDGPMLRFIPKNKP